MVFEFRPFTEKPRNTYELYLNDWHAKAKQVDPIIYEQRRLDDFDFLTAAVEDWRALPKEYQAKFNDAMLKEYAEWKKAGGHKENKG